MSAAEVIRKKGRPKKSVAETIAIIDEPVLVKAKKPRVSCKSTTTSPNDQSKLTKDVGSPEAQKNDEPLPSPPRAVKEPKSRPMKSVTAETAILASQQITAPSTRPEPSLILKQATAFVGSQKDKSSSKSSDPVTVEPQTRPKEFKSAGTLPSVCVTEAIKVSTPALSQSKPPLFLADFFAQPPLAEQPAWSRPKTKEVAATPTLFSIPPAAATGPEIAALGGSNTSSLLSTSPLPLNPQLSNRGSSANQVLREPISSVDARLAPSPGQSTNPEQQPIRSGTPARAAPSPASQAQMPSNPTTERPTPTSASPPKSIPPPSTKSNPTIPKLPTPPPQGSPRAKPTEMAYEELRRDPKFRALSRRYTALIVSIPILLATSYALYGRYTETTVQRKRARDQGTSTINGGV